MGQVSANVPEASYARPPFGLEETGAREVRPSNMYFGAPGSTTPYAGVYGNTSAVSVAPMTGAQLACSFDDEVESSDGVYQAPGDVFGPLVGEDVSTLLLHLQNAII